MKPEEVDFRNAGWSQGVELMEVSSAVLWSYGARFFSYNYSVGSEDPQYEAERSFTGECWCFHLVIGIVS